MRPPDENQNGSTRPNFMSASRRAGGADDNILARLERDAKRATSGKSWKNQTRLAWCGLASLAVVGLIATLASLAKENMAVHRQPLVIEAKASPPEPVAVPASAAPRSKSGFAPLPAGTVKMAAAVIEVAPERAVAISSPPVHVPPMVMLKPAAAAKPAATPPAARSTPPKANANAKSTPAKSAPSGTSAPARTAVAASPARTVVATAPARPAVAAPSPRPVVAAAAPARPKKTTPAAPSARPEPAAIDSDIALLSAIIMHASRHAGERAQMEAAQCGAGKKCPPSDLQSPPKATD